MQANVMEGCCNIKQESAIKLEQGFKVGQDDFENVQRESDAGTSTDEDLINICDTKLKIETTCVQFDVSTKLEPKNVKDCGRPPISTLDPAEEHGRGCCAYRIENVKAVSAERFAAVGEQEHSAKNSDVRVDISATFSKKISRKSLVRKKEKRQRCQPESVRVEKTSRRTYDDTVVLCGICGKTWKKSYLWRHRKYAHGMEIECYFCDKSFSQPAMLNRHVSTVHMKQNQIGCGECEKVFCNSMSLNRHLKEKHSATKGRDFTCKVCNRGFSRRTTLATHIEFMHVPN